MDNGVEMVENDDPNESNGGVILSNNGVKRVKRADYGAGKLLPNDSKEPVMRGMQKMVPTIFQSFSTIIPISHGFLTVNTSSLY